MHEVPLPPSPFVVAALRHVPPGGRILDLACGSGRHTLLARAQGHPVLAVDRDAAAVLERARTDPGIEVWTADLEGAAWPLAGASFAGVIVTNYLWRPRLPDVLANVAIVGVLIYETFAEGHERFGRPRNPDFLLRAGELQQAVAGTFSELAYEHGPEGEPVHSVRQRILAMRCR